MATTWVRKSDYGSNCPGNSGCYVLRFREVRSSGVRYYENCSGSAAAYSGKLPEEQGGLQRREAGERTYIHSFRTRFHSRVVVDRMNTSSSKLRPAAEEALTAKIHSLSFSWLSLN